MLFHKFIKPYEITRRHFKGINTVMVYMGFPDKGLSSIMEICTSGGFKIEQNNQLIKITGFENVGGFEEWKADIKKRPDNASESIQEYGKCTSKSNEQIEMDIIKIVSAYPLAVKTPLECQQFIHELQSIINGPL